MEPKWANPCNRHQPMNCNSGPPDVTNKVQLLKDCVSSVRIANETAKEFQRRKLINFETYRSLPKYDWLPELHEDINYEQVEEALPMIYENLQRVAVGLEQLVRENSDPDLSKQENKNLMVLCQLKETMITLKICPRPDIPSEIMGDEDREGDHTKRTTRKMIIIREYINNLDHAESVLRQFSP